MPKSSPPDYEFAGTPPRIAILVAGDTARATDAQNAIAKTGASAEIHSVPSALELAAALRMTLNADRFEGYVVISALADTDTVLYAETLRALQSIAAGGHAVGIALLHSDTGPDAAHGCLSLISLSQRMSNRPKGIGFKPASEHIIIAKGDGGPSQA